MQCLFSSHMFMSELRRSLRVLDREEDAFEPLADELVEVVLGMLDTKSLGRTVCCNRRLQQLASEALRDREEKLATIRSLILERNDEPHPDDASAPRLGFAAIEEMILPSVSILRAETRHEQQVAAATPRPRSCAVSFAVLLFGRSYSLRLAKLAGSMPSLPHRVLILTMPFCS